MSGGIIVDEIGWIACADELPDSDTTVIVYSPESDEPVWLGYFDDGFWFAIDGADYGGDGEPGAEVTHWADLPRGPKS